MSPWEANRFSVQVFPIFYGTRRYIIASRSARHSVLLVVFRNHLPELSHITKRVADSCFGRKMNSVNRIGLQVWNGSCELLRALQTCLRVVGSARLFFNMVDVVFGTRCVQMPGDQILYCGAKYLWGPQCGTCVMSPFWSLEFWGVS
jgi:hypothetical protein